MQRRHRSDLGLRWGGRGDVSTGGGWGDAEPFCIGGGGGRRSVRDVSPALKKNSREESDLKKKEEICYSGGRRGRTQREQTGELRLPKENFRDQEKRAVVE